jgi:hypothetical protein
MEMGVLGGVLVEGGGRRRRRMVWRNFQHHRMHPRHLDYWNLDGPTVVVVGVSTIKRGARRMTMTRRRRRTEHHFYWHRLN